MSSPHLRGKATTLEYCGLGSQNGMRLTHTLEIFKEHLRLYAYRSMVPALRDVRLLDIVSLAIASSYATILLKDLVLA